MIAVAAALVMGVYVVAVLDAAGYAAVGGRNVRAALLLPFRRAARLLVQSRPTTERPDAAAWASAVALAAAAAAAGLAAIPLGPGLRAADVPDGLALYGAAIAMVLVAVYLHGWSSNSLFPLLGAYRFAAQGLSYPIPLLLVLISTALPAESLAVGDIVESQAGLWNVVRQPLGLPLLLVTGAALAWWGPLDLPDGTDIAGGTEVEAGGPGLLAWRAARAGVLVGVAAMGAAAFLGGWHGPFLPGGAWMALKTFALLALLVVGSHHLARLPVERFVLLAWTTLIPLSLLDVFVSGALAL